MTTEIVREFARHLLDKSPVRGDLLARLGPADGKDRKLRDLWEMTELSANDFAD